jgi:hypothetical protein
MRWALFVRRVAPRQPFDLQILTVKKEYMWKP